MEKYPIWTLELQKSETDMESVNEICAYFAQKIDEHPKAAYIGVFDHFDHTKSQDDGEIHSDIKAAKIVVFCFGPKIPNPQVLAVRPRSIAICEVGDKYVISFLEAPAEDINAIMEEWAKALKK